MTLPDSALQRVSEYYTTKLREHGPTAAGADWRDQASQELRFSELVKVTRGATSGRLVEVGCGWGAFPLWAQRNGYGFDYVGYDVAPEMVASARDTCRNLRSTQFRLGATQFEPADWVIASGIFNVRFDISDRDWRVIVDSTIDAMAVAADKGFAFNCLTGFSDADRKRPHLYYPDPGETLDSVMRRYGRHAALLHDTGLYEFTILVWHGLNVA
jgi:hypothetical protein